jgi:hypothetical protein
VDCWLIDDVLLQDDLELGRIEMVKHNQTTQHVDVSVMPRFVVR